MNKLFIVESFIRRFLTDNLNRRHKCNNFGSKNQLIGIYSFKMSYFKLFCSFL